MTEEDLPEPFEPTTITEPLEFKGVVETLDKEIVEAKAHAIGNAITNPKNANEFRQEIFELNKAIAHIYLRMMAECELQERPELNARFKKMLKDTIKTI